MYSLLLYLLHLSLNEQIQQSQAKNVAGKSFTSYIKT